MADVRESIAHLYSLGRFQDVRVDAATRRPPAGSACASTSCRSRACRSVEFTGTLGLDRGLLRRTIADRYGARPPIARARRCRAHARGALPRITATSRAVRAGRAGSARTRRRTVLTFEIEPGPQATIAEVTIDGDPRTPRDAFLERQLQVRTRRALRAAGAAAPPRRVHPRSCASAASTRPAPASARRSRRTGRRST